MAKENFYAEGVRLHSPGRREALLASPGFTAILFRSRGAAAEFSPGRREALLASPGFTAIFVRCEPEGLARKL